MLSSDQPFFVPVGMGVQLIAIVGLKGGEGRGLKQTCAYCIK